MEVKVWLRSICLRNGFGISEEQIDLLRTYSAHLLEWNKKINLISRKDESHIWTRHILSSIAPLFRFEFISESTIIDIGTGGGLPGIPIAILVNNVNVTLADATQKKIRAVTDIVSRLHLERVQTFCGRVEEFGRTRRFHRSFDHVLARGVGSISQLIGWCVPLLKLSAGSGSSPEANLPRTKIEPGSIVLWKGGDLTRELAQAGLKHGLQQIDTYPLQVDGIDPAEMVDKKIVIIHP